MYKYRKSDQVIDRDQTMPGHLWTGSGQGQGEALNEPLIEAGMWDPASFGTPTDSVRGSAGRGPDGCPLGTTSSTVLRRRTCKVAFAPNVGNICLTYCESPALTPLTVIRQRGHCAVLG